MSKRRDEIVAAICSHRVVVVVGESQVDLTFNVTEGKRFRIRRIQISGVDKIDEDDLLNLIHYRFFDTKAELLRGLEKI